MFTHSLLPFKYIPLLHKHAFVDVDVVPVVVVFARQLVHALQLLAPPVLYVPVAQAPHVLPVPVQSLLLGVLLLPPPELKYPASILLQLPAPPVLYVPPGHKV